MRVVVAGGGAIGAACAYFLSRRRVEATVVESTGVACAASGKSGGFLARDWSDGTPLGSLSRHSFDLHEELASAIDRDWGWRRLDTVGVAASAKRALPSGSSSIAPDWLAANTHVHGQLGTKVTTAQVTPALFTQALLQEAVDAGTSLVSGCVESIGVDGSGKLSAVVVDGIQLPADAVVIALGPWSDLARAWVPGIPRVFGLKGHSVVFRPPEAVGAQALFSEVETARGEVLTPEIYPRPDGSIYVCGLSGEAPLPADPAQVQPDPGRCRALAAAAGLLSGAMAAAFVETEQACYRPITQDGLPLIGPVQGVDGVYVATGHSVWGILNAPATGEAIAELITEGAAVSVDISAFAPERLSRVSP